MSPVVTIFDDANTDLIVMEFLLHGISFADIFINFSTPYQKEAGFIVINRKKIAVKYIFSWFFIDLIAAISFDLLTHPD